MAFSGAQKTRLGLAGFTRQLYGSFAGKAESASFDLTFGVSGMISERGQGVSGLISETGQGVSGLITESFGVAGSIQERGQSVAGNISGNGQGVSGQL